MKLRSSKILGLAVGQKSILLAEVATKSGRPVVQHFAEFNYPEGVSLNTPEKLGEALAQFLRGRKFSTRDAVIGLPAKRLLTRRKDVPPASPAMAAGALRLQAEGEFSGDDTLVVDFSGSTSTTAASSVLLIATAQSVIDQCLAMAKATGLKVLGITATSASLGRATSRLPGGDGLVLNLTSNGAELVMQHGEDTTYLRHLNILDSSVPEAITALAGEIRRTVAALPRNGSPLTMTLWNSATAADPGTILSERLSIPVTSPELRNLVATDAPEANEFAPAVTVALSALEPQGLPVDFLNSRLAIPKDTSKRRKVVLIAAGAALVLGLITAAVGNLYLLGSKVAELNQTIQNQQPKVKAANVDIDKLKFVQSWSPQDFHFTSCLFHVTLLFPNRGTIWASSLANSKDQNSWILTGKCTNEQEAQELLAQMVKDPTIGSPKLTWQEDQQSRLTNFTIAFTFPDRE